MDLGSEKIRISVKFVAPVNCYTPWILRLAENSTSPDGHQLFVNESATVQEMIDAIVAGYALLKNIDTSLLIRPCACALVFAAYRYPLEFGINLAVLRLRTMYEFIGREHSGVPVSSVTGL